MSAKLLFYKDFMTTEPVRADAVPIGPAFAADRCLLHARSTRVMIGTAKAQRADVRARFSLAHEQRNQHASARPSYPGTLASVLSPLAFG